MSRRLARPAAILLLVGLAAGCASVEAETPAQRVYALKADYRAVLTVAVAYESLPRCAAARPRACSAPEVVDLLREADAKAAAALDGAERVVRSPAASDSSAALAIEAARVAVAVVRQILADAGHL